MAANGKAFVQGGLSSTIVSTRTKANRKHKSSTKHVSARLATNAMLGTVFIR